MRAPTTSGAPPLKTCAWISLILFGALVAVNALSAGIENQELVSEPSSQERAIWERSAWSSTEAVRRRGLARLTHAELRAALSALQ
jgi:hypothetical protein